MHIEDQLEIRLLGQTLVRRRDGRVVSAKEWRTAKSLELVRLLAVSHPEPVPVDLVLERLWPQAPAKNAQANLRTAIYHGRLAMGDGAIERSGETLTLNNAWTDVQAYAVLAGDVEHARRAGQSMRVASLARAAAALYVGDINTCSSGEWSIQAQHEWRELRQNVLLASAEAAAAMGRMHEALDHAGEARTIDGSSERAVRVMMRALGGLGEIRKAIAVFEELREELAESYGVDPAPQTRALHLQLLRATAGRPAGRTSETVEPVGHTEAIEQLAEALRHSFMSADLESVDLMSADGGGRAGVAWVVGEPGSGRGAVIEAACVRAGTPLYSGARLSSPATADADSRTPDMVVLGPELVRAGREQVLRMHSWALSAGVVAVVPVSQLTTDATAMMAARSAELPHVTVSVDRLDRGELTELLWALLQEAPAPALVDVVWQRTSGRSGEVCKTIASWLDDGRVVWTPDGMSLGAGPGADPVFATTSGRVLSALGTLDHRAIETLAVVAVVGRSVPAGVVDRILARIQAGAAVQTRDVLNGLVDRGLLRVSGRGYRMRNAQAQNDVCAWLRPGMLRRLHAVVAEEVSSTQYERVLHLIASGHHQVALEEGAGMLVRARARGDVETAEALMDLLHKSPLATRQPITVAAS